MYVCIYEEQQRVESLVKARDLERKFMIYIHLYTNLYIYIMHVSQVQQRVEHLVKAHEISIKHFEEELGTWRAHVQDLELKLRYVMINF